jgi:hypothetical protein
MQPISTRKIDKLKEINAQLESLIIELETRVSLKNIQEARIYEAKKEARLIFSNSKQ